MFLNSTVLREDGGVKADIPEFHGYTTESSFLFA